MSWNRVTRDDLLSWADSEEAQGRLPELIRRLVHETAPGLMEALDFPGGTGITKGGFDGFVRSSGTRPFIPPGRSVWEVSVRKNAARKADGDIQKRTLVPDGSPVAEATYVQVICRPWTKAAEWARRWSESSEWSEVRGYNVDHLVAWVEQAPATRVWLLEQLGKPTVGVLAGSTWWTRWREATEPPLTAELTLARDLGDLAGAMERPGLMTVGGPVGTDEIMACIAAAAAMDDDLLLNRLVVVDHRDAWRRLLNEAVPLVLVAGDSGFAADVPPDTPHTALVPLPYFQNSQNSDVPIGLVKTGEVHEHLREIDDQLPGNLAPLARRSFVSFRRRLARKPELMHPPWARKPVPRAVRAALLVTSWNDESEGDREIVEALAGVPYETAREELLTFTAGDDPLLSSTAGRWFIVSVTDAWQQLGGALPTDDLRRFEDQARKVLTEPDPALELPPEDRWRANIAGKVRRYSSSLRDGIATGLAALGTYGDTVVDATGRHGEGWAAGFLRALFERANADPSGEGWASISPLLRTLVEASPRTVLDAIRKGVTGSSPPLATIFQDADAPGGDILRAPRSPHSYFLWALETAAWSEEHFGDAADLIASLARLDPGGRLANRPADCLATILCPWHPDTAADVDQRLAFLDRLVKRQPETAWSLMVGLLPRGTGTHHPTAEPTLRDWKPTPYEVLKRDYRKFIEGLVDRLLERAQTAPRLWSELIERHESLPPDLRASVRKAAEDLDIGRLSDDEKRTLWESLRAFIARHRRHSAADWALPRDELVSLDDLAVALQPSSLKDRVRWLFAKHMVELDDCSWDDFQANEEEVARRRVKAVREIFAVDGLAGLIAFAAGVEAKVVGAAVADAFADDDTLSSMLTMLESGSETAKDFAAIYLRRRAAAEGLEWVLSVLENRPALRPATQAALLHDSWMIPEGWREARARGPAVELEYWKRFQCFGRGPDFPDLPLAADRLCKARRPADALELLLVYQSKDGVDAGDHADSTASALEALLEQAADEEAHRLRRHHFEEAFTVLDDHVEHLGLRRVIPLQWHLLPVLGHDPPTTTLHRALAEEPAFFVEVLSCVYRPRSASEAEGETAPQQAERAYRLLSSWCLAPGTSASGFNADRCREWIERVQPLLENADRVAVGMNHVGQVLVSVPAGNGGWPSHSVAALIEDVASDDMDKGIDQALYNGRGLTWRGIHDGGEQELTLAEDYRARAKIFRDSHPRTARILNDLADTYEAEARWIDRDAEPRRLGLSG